MQRLKTFSKNVITAILAVVFFANVTFAHSIDFHLCQGELQSVAFFGEKATCSKMLEAEAKAPLSCCDLLKKRTGLNFDQKSCCDNVQVVQDNVLLKPSLDVEQSVEVLLDITNVLSANAFILHAVHFVGERVEIPPPPNIAYHLTPETLQVFII